MAKYKTKRRGLGVGIDESTANSTLVRLNRDINAGHCHIALDAIRTIEAHNARSPQRGVEARDYGEVLHHFGQRCIVRRKRRS